MDVLRFNSFLTVLQTFQKDGRVIKKGSVQGNHVKYSVFFTVLITAVFRMCLSLQSSVCVSLQSIVLLPSLIQYFSHSSLKVVISGKYKNLNKITKI